MHLDLKDLAYHRQIAHLIGALDKPNFWVLLVRTLRNFIECDNWVVLRFSNHEKPVVYIENPTADGGVDLLFRDYLNGLYLFDPFFVASRDRAQSGLFLLDEVAPEDFTSTDYYRLYFHLNIVADEIQFNCALDHNETLCFSLGRGSKYTPSEIAFLSVIAPWVVALMQQRQHFEGHGESLAAQGSGIHWQDGVEHAISRLNGTRLTSREVEVGQLMLSGFSAKNIAEKLKISIETVRAHKKHMYTKLDINSQSELFAIFYQAQAKSSPVLGVAA
ncbi:MAG: helix-turn-helix transcriptional regulator [Rhodocyclaceae bacterium]|nr:helix-turn-helix transcriptional regulator [Rhodocyclaceae bacterium]MBL0076315.1 helix-turn-helix transcriptional regulator [Rhodocyclaceae bacterium]